MDALFWWTGLLWWLAWAVLCGFLGVGMVRRVWPRRRAELRRAAPRILARRPSRVVVRIEAASAESAAEILTVLLSTRR
jgi:hypothetical protein